jgi:tRNA-Thr(GGU) m(6)t(6)A37 methyltransferase TsaA
MHVSIEVMVMKSRFEISAIGSVRTVEGRFYLQLKEDYIPALTHLAGFGHLQIVWWAHLTDSPQDRETLVVGKLFREGPDRLGIFATRAPARPNPIMISTVRVKAIDSEQGIIQLRFIDADDGTPILDIKPYFPMERVKEPQVPAWCRHWPKWQEEAMTFDWHTVINYE